MLTWFVPLEGHGGTAMAKASLDALAAHPAALTLRRHRARLSLVGGDGAVVSGGPGRPKPGTQAGEILWGLVHPGSGGPTTPANRAARLGDEGVLPACTEWDKFHREDIALSRAIAGSPMAEEVFAVSHALDTLFHR